MKSTENSSERNRLLIQIAEVAIVIGIATNVLIRSDEPGINIFLITLLLLAGVNLLVRRFKPEYWTGDFIALNIAALFFSSMFIFFDAEHLLVRDAMALVLIFGVMSLPALKRAYRSAGILAYLGSVATSAMSSWFGPLFVVFNDFDWKKLPRSASLKLGIDVARGLAIAVPVVAVIVALLVAADRNFERLVVDNFLFRIDNVVSHVILSGVFAWLTLGFLRGVMFGIETGDPKPVTPKPNSTAAESPRFSVTEHTTEDPDKPASARVNETPEKPAQNLAASLIPSVARLGAVEVWIVLGLLNVVFLAFVVIQVPYLFGGMDLVQNTPDFKLAEYARRGVSELILVAIIVLPLLLVLHRLLKDGDSVAGKTFQALAGVQVGLLFVILWSAMQRLLLLTGDLGYGMSVPRFYSMIFLIWLALVFAWFAMTVLRGLRSQFAYGAFWSGLFILGCVHFLNPDGFIAQRNIDLMNQGREFDAEYNASLSDDAVPVLIRALPDMNAEDRRTTLRDFKRWCGDSGLRGWNVSRYNAAVIKEQNGLLDCK